MPLCIPVVYIFSVQRIIEVTISCQCIGILKNRQVTRILSFTTLLPFLQLVFLVPVTATSHPSQNSAKHNFLSHGNLVCACTPSTKFLLRALRSAARLKRFPRPFGTFYSSIYAGTGHESGIAKRKQIIVPRAI